MANLKELRIRQKSIASTHKLTSAMMMISRARFSKVKGVWNKSKEALTFLQELTSRAFFLWEDAQERLRYNSPPQDLPKMLQEPDPSLPILLVFCTSDKGLSGGFNQDLAKKAHEFLTEKEQNGQEVHMIFVGKQGLSLLQKVCNPVIIEVFSKIMHFQYEEIHPILELVFSLFHDGHVGVCYVLSSHFKNALTQEPRIVQFLPELVTPHPEKNLLPEGMLACEPSPHAVLQSTLNLLYRSHFYTLMQEHSLSEHSARMNAMHSATENAKEIMNALTATYNHLRQSIITEELIEVISGAEALA